MEEEVEKSPDLQEQPDQTPAEKAQDFVTPSRTEIVTTQSMESRIRAVLELLVSSGSHSAQRFSEELAILKRWYYRSHKIGEIFFASQEGELPMRRIVRATARVYRGEKEAPVLPQIEQHSS
jgi:hypothetical protein